MRRRHLSKDLRPSLSPSLLLGVGEARYRTGVRLSSACGVTGSRHTWVYGALRATCVPFQPDLFFVSFSIPLLWVAETPGRHRCEFVRSLRDTTRLGHRASPCRAPRERIASTPCGDRTRPHRRAPTQALPNRITLGLRVSPRRSLLCLGQRARSAFPTRWPMTLQLSSQTESPIRGAAA